MILPRQARDKHRENSKKSTSSQPVSHAGTDTRVSPRTKHAMSRFRFDAAEVRSSKDNKV
jgi:hypothetical protein